MSATLEMRGFLATDVASISTQPDPEAIAELFSLPAVSAHSPANWRDFDFATPFGKALLSWCKSRQSGTPPAVRYGQLMRGLELVQMAVDADDNHPAVAALGLRLCSDMGLRAQSVAIAEAFLAQMGPEDEFPIDRPMPPPYEVFDQRTPLVGLGQFFYQSLIEFHLDRATHSTIYTKEASFDFGPGLANPEHSARFERTAVLKQARDSKPLALPGEAKLFDAAPDNLNSEFWRQLASEGELLTVRDKSPWTDQASNEVRLTTVIREAQGLFEDGESASALDVAQTALLTWPNDGRLLKLAGAAAHASGQLDIAYSFLARAIAGAPDEATLHTKLAMVCAQNGQPEEAEAAYLLAIKIDPQHTEALAGLGSLHLENNRPTEAEKAFVAALNLQPWYVHANNQMGVLRSAAGDYHGAETFYRRALESDPEHAPALNNLGALLIQTHRFDAAAQVLLQAVATSPEFADAHNNLGLVFLRTNRFDEAERSFSSVIALRPDHSSAYINLGVLQKEQGRFSDAEISFRRAAAIDQNSGNALAQAYYCARHCCDWSQMVADETRLMAMLAQGVTDIPPFIFLTVDSAGDDNANAVQLRAGLLYSSQRYPLKSGRECAPRKPKGSSDRLRIAYLSSDFYAHATMHLLLGVFKEHDRSRYSIHVYSYGPTEDEMTQQVRDNSENFRDLRGLSDEAAAQLIASDGIEILVDLKGYTHSNRLGICAYRPAPVIVSWLGYPGTLGNQQLADVIIGDSIVTPADNAEYFSERIARLPNCYQPNDRLRELAAMPTRTAVGLPEAAFVFCCFNSVYKISPSVFNQWCRLLKDVPDSVLWLLAGSPSAIRNLKSAASANGVDPDRLIFASFVPQAEHLARIQLADLALDTFPCGSHTTASDALWAGVPLVTMMGQSFVSRVAASLLTAHGFPELITETKDDYFQLTRSLACSPGKLAVLREKLAHARLSSPLFDTRQLTIDLEKLFESIWTQCVDEGIDQELTDPPAGLRLHIGGVSPKTGWKILNALPGPNVDYVGDIRDLSGFADASFVELYCSHVLEHVSQNEILGTLKQLYRILAPGGRLSISVPDLDVLCEHFLDPSLSETQRFHVMRMIFGGQIDRFDFHYIGLNREFLTSYLNQAGFTSIDQLPVLGIFDDTSNFAPYGKYISLNLVAIKSATDPTGTVHRLTE